MKKDKGCLVFDGDDTLWYNSYKYHLPILKCAEIICKALNIKSIHPLDLLKIFDEIDRKSIKKEGFSKNRFPNSWLITYRRICLQRNIKPDKKVEEKILSTARKFSQPPFPMVKDVKRVLRILKKRGYYLILLTAGDSEVQNRKIKYNRLDRYFDEIKIVTRDKNIELKKIAKRFGVNKVWMIGNSQRSDIAAALSIPIKAIYIPCFTWSYENIELDKKIYKKYVTEIKNIQKLLEIF